MKNYFFSLLALTFLMTSACKDDDCVAGDLETTIVGEWSVSFIGIPAGDVEFEANGTLIDPDGALIEGEAGGVQFTEKSYTVASNSQFTVRAEDAAGVNSVSYDVDVTSYNCDEIIIDVLGFEGKLSRK